MLSNFVRIDTGVYPPDRLIVECLLSTGMFMCLERRAVKIVTEDMLVMQEMYTLNSTWCEPMHNAFNIRNEHVIAWRRLPDLYNLIEEGTVTPKEMKAMLAGVEDE